MEDKVTEEILKQLNQIRILLQLQTREALADEIRRVVSTSDRQKMWKLCDGNSSSREIAKRSGKSLRAVQYFLTDAKNAGILELTSDGLPRRAFDMDVEWEREDI